MKILITILLCGLAAQGQKISRTASIMLNGNVKTVFPLFGAYEEKKWAAGWKPQPVYPSTETIEEEATFTTPGHFEGEKDYVWRVSKYDPGKFLIQYMVYGENRCWTITIQCEPKSDTTTAARITYSFIGLNAQGNQSSQEFIDRIYQHDLKDWEQEINNFLAL
ncbi:hypothetical protein [Chitinophaga vietnamensis]|uniref:hypothetical protein n=1 Tax=Chitinophaga vietnamensis TaxID=2593957 RepID=UPI0011779DE8|nr:hypothetical protein [Chitinophaga vietnamensis]